MTHQWPKPRIKPRSPAPLRTPTTPSQFFPPSYFAAAAGIPYPPNRDDNGSLPQVRTPSTPSLKDQLRQEECPLSSNASYLTTECSHPSNLVRARRKSQLGDLSLLESHLLPTLSDTIERMTRPPSQVISNPLSRPVPGPAYSPGVARAPSTSSQGSSAYSVKSEPHGPSVAAAQAPTIESRSGELPLRSPSHAYPEQPPSSVRSSSSRSNPKSILKSHTISDQHLQVRQTHLEDLRLPTDHARKAGRSPIPVPLEPVLPENKAERVRQVPTSPRPKIDGSLRTGRARSRTDPGTLPKGLSSVHGRNTQQPNSQHSSIPRRVGVPPSPATSRISTVAQMSTIGSEAGTVKSTQLEKRRLFVTGTEISSSSSSEGQVPLACYMKPKALTRTDSQSSAESQLRPPRFGLGLGLSSVSEAKNPVKSSPGQRWTTKIPSDESHLHHTSSPSSKKHQRNSTPKRGDRSPSRNPRVDSAGGQRRRRELFSPMQADLNDSNGCDSQPSGSEESGDRCLVSDRSGDSLRSGFDDSASEYSPAEDDGPTVRRISTRHETRLEQMRSKSATRRSRINLSGDSELLKHDDQYTPRASSTSLHSRQSKGEKRGYPVAATHDDGFLESESSTLASDQDTSSIDGTVTRVTPERYSSELSRIMAVSIAAAAQQRQVFGINSSPDPEDRRAGSSELPHADSDLSLIGGDRWQDECDDLVTGSLLQQLNRTCGTGGRKPGSQRSSADKLSFSSTQTRSSVSQDSIYSIPSSLMRRSSRAIVVPESPPAIFTVRDQQWQTLQRHILGSYGELEVQRQRLVWEFTESEDNFVTRLQNMIQLFILPLKVRDTRMWVAGIPSDVMKLFDWLDDIVRVHTQLSSTLASRQIVNHPRLQLISEVFRDFVPRLETYQPYLVKLESTASLIDSFVHEGKNDFGDFIKLQEASEHCRGWSLEKYLIEPVNRLVQYPEVFRRLQHLTPKSHPDYMSTFSLFHAAKLAIRVLSEVKNREDAYQLVKMACSRIKGISSVHFVNRERRLLIRGSLACTQVSNEEQVLSSEPLAGNQTVSQSDIPLGQHNRRTDKLFKAVNIWRGRSNSIKSSASTVVSFGTAPSSFDVHVGQPVVGAPMVLVESEPVDAEVLVFTDLVLLASRLPLDENGVDTCDLGPLERFGLSRIVSVLDEIDRRACITLDLAPLTSRALEEGYVQSTGPVTTISLSLPRRAQGALDDELNASLHDWLVPLQRCCRYTLRSLSSLNNTTSALVSQATSAMTAPKPVLSILAAGLPFPKSPSMQIEESERGLASNPEQQEREERGWWSKRFHEVLSELSEKEGCSAPT